MLSKSSIEPAHKYIPPEKFCPIEEGNKTFNFDNFEHCTDKKENKLFLIYKEIHKGAVARSYMTNGLIIYD